MSRRAGAPALIAIALWLATWAWEMPMTASAEHSAWMAAHQVQGSPAAAQLAGSFRTVGANVLWMKVDEYHHEWAEVRGLDWTQNKSLLPLLRAITYLDPHFTEAYETYGSILMHQNQPAQSVAILDEGIRNNPACSSLNEEAAIFYGWNLKQPAQARVYLTRALTLATDPFDRTRIARSLRMLDTPRKAAHKA